MDAGRRLLCKCRDAPEKLYLRARQRVAWCCAVADMNPHRRQRWGSQDTCPVSGSLTVCRIEEPWEESAIQCRRAHPLYRSSGTRGESETNLRGYQRRALPILRQPSERSEGCSCTHQVTDRPAPQPSLSSLGIPDIAAEECGVYMCRRAWPFLATPSPTLRHPPTPLGWTATQSSSKGLESTSKVSARNPSRVIVGDGTPRPSLWLWCPPRMFQVLGGLIFFPL